MPEVDPVLSSSATGPAAGLWLNDVHLLIDQCPILTSISLNLGRGRVLGVLGPNGAGKTSLLRRMSGQRRDHEACSGDVFWRGWALDEMDVTERARRVAVVNQLNDGVFSLTLRQIVSMGLLPHQSLLSRQKPADQARITRALERVGLADKAERRFSSLSGGEQQRGLIARALVQQAELIVLDEPVNHLDVFYQHDILALLGELAHEQGMAVVMSLHDLNLAAAYCDTLALMDQGRLTGFGTPAQVLQSHLLEAVFRLPCQVRQTEADTLHVDFFPHRRRSRASLNTTSHTLPNVTPGDKP